MTKERAIEIAEFLADVLENIIELDGLEGVLAKIHVTPEEMKELGY